MEIHCGNFLLRPLQMSDRESMAKYANNYKIWKNVRDHLPHPYTVEDAANFLAATIEANPVTSFCIEVNQECAGAIGIVLQPDVHRKSAEFGYWLGEPFWNQGIATTAARRFTEHVFTNLDIVRLYAGVFAYNKASMRVLEKAGFTFDCIFHKAVFKDDQLIDEYRYSLLHPSLL